MVGDTWLEHVTPTTSMWCATNCANRPKCFICVADGVLPLSQMWHLVTFARQSANRPKYFICVADGALPLSQMWHLVTFVQQSANRPNNIYCTIDGSLSFWNLHNKLLSVSLFYHKNLKVHSINLFQDVLDIFHKLSFDEQKFLFSVIVAFIFYFRKF